MADELSMALLELLRKADAEDRVDFVRTAVERLAQPVIDVEAEQHVGPAGMSAPRGHGTSATEAARGSDTTAGTVHLRVPKTRKGSFMPALYPSLGHPTPTRATGLPP